MKKKYSKWVLENPTEYAAFTTMAAAPYFAA